MMFMIKTRCRSSKLHGLLSVLLIFCQGVGCGWGLKPAAGRGLGPLSLTATPEGCQIIKDGAARMRCYDDLGLDVAQDRTQSGAAAGDTEADTWKLVRTPDPAGGREAVSVTRTADVSRSDLEFAGLMLRCGERSIDVLVVLVRVFPPRARPKVEITTGSSSAEFTASVVQPGVLLLLPPDATALAVGSWQAATELTVTIEGEQGAIRGVVPLTGLGRAIALLKSSCPPH
jgi:hypothetical protein